jgi:hypothetical protein
MTNNSNLSEEIHKIIDDFTQTDGVERYISDLEESILQLFTAHLTAYKEELLASLPKEKERPASGPQRNGTTQAVRRAYNQCLSEVKQVISKEKIDG